MRAGLLVLLSCAGCLDYDALSSEASWPGVCAQASCQFKTAPPSWNETARFPIDAAHLALAAGLDGRLYAFGGGTGSREGPTISGKSFRFDPAGDQWSPIADLPTARIDLAAAVDAQGRIYVAGGSDGTNALAAVEIYTPDSGQWSAGPPLPTARSGLALVTAADGEVYAIGGTSGGVVTAAVEIYSPSTGRWSRGVDLPSPRAFLGAAALADGRLVAVGGFDGSVSLDRVDAWSPTSGAWAPLASLTVARSHVAAVRAPDDRVYAIAGSMATGVYPDDVEVYLASVDTWTRLPSSNFADGEARAAAIALDGRVYVAGTDNFNFFGVVERYGPHLERMSSDRVPAGATVMLAGDNFAASASVEIHLGTRVIATQAQTDAQGVLAPLMLTLPAGVSGPEWIFVSDDASHYPVRVPITITP
jgi:hypothetical protein